MTSGRGLGPLGRTCPLPAVGSTGCSGKVAMGAGVSEPHSRSTLPPPSAVWGISVKGLELLLCRRKDGGVRLGLSRTVLGTDSAPIEHALYWRSSWEQPRRGWESELVSQGCHGKSLQQTTEISSPFRTPEAPNQGVDRTRAPGGSLGPFLKLLGSPQPLALRGLGTHLCKPASVRVHKAFPSMCLCLFPLLLLDLGSP